MKFSETIPETILPKKPQMLVNETKIETSAYPRARPICPMLFMTANPVPTPHRNDTNMIQKSKLFRTSAIVCSSPITGLRFTLSSSEIAKPPSSSFPTTTALSPSSSGSGRRGCSASSELELELHRAEKNEYAGTATGEARRTRRTAAKARERAAPGFGKKL